MTYTYQSLLTLILPLTIIVSSAYAQTVVLVGLSHFPPFIEAREQKIEGLAADMLELMNQHQDKYDFQGVATLSNTRHKIFGMGRYDMSMFDNLAWGWSDFDVDASEVFLKGGEVYIARAEPGRDQSYFMDFNNKTMIGIKGYHYKFADYKSDEAYLVSNFNMQLTKSVTGSINMLLNGNRGDIAVVSKSFLAQYFNKFPLARQKILVSKKIDQAYNHSIIIRKGIKPSIDEIDQILKELNQNGKLPNLWRKIAPDSIY
jgi:polar amino acid transport system substrate-binding protein